MIKLRKWVYFRLVITVFLFLIFLSILRILFIALTHHLSINPISFSEYFTVFLRGFVFDAIVVGYSLTIPLFISLLIHFNIKQKLLLKLIIIWFSFYISMTTLAFFIDIPYFNYHFSHITIALFNWVDTPGMMLKQAFSDFFNIFLLVILMVLIFSIVKVVKLLFKMENIAKINAGTNIGLFLILSSVTFLMMRGRISAPLKENFAIISSNSYVNQLALNPIFTFVKSINYNVNFFKEEEALNLCRKFLSVDKDAKYIERKIQFNTPCDTNYNVVIIIMESMTQCNIDSNNPEQSLTPFLSTLVKKSYYFPNAWSTGKHTSNGIYSTLYSFPAIWSRRPTGSSIKTTYCGLPGTLKLYGYKTVFFTTHDLSFDNLYEFLPNNHFDEYYGVNYYSKKEIVGMYGVPDHVMFRYVVNYLNKQTKPFLCVVLTASNHGPYYLPDSIKLKHKGSNIQQKMIEYADWSIAQFFKQANSAPWFRNTLFVLVADHGFNIKSENKAVPLCIHNIPIIFYAPFILNDTIDWSLASQMDIFPSIMHILRKNYVNNTFGIDLFNEKRIFVYYSEDDKLICQNNRYMYLFTKSKNEYLYDLFNEEKNYNAEKKQLLKEMKEYMLSQLQIANKMIEQRCTYCINN